MWYDSHLPQRALYSIAPSAGVKPGCCRGRSTIPCEVELFAVSLDQVLLMPSRRSDASDGPSASRRTSLRRLSSIASLQTFFSRRKSHNTDDTLSSSLSNLSLSSSTIVNPPQSTVESSQHNDAVKELPPLPFGSDPVPSTRGSYICLPDDPIGGMPRSRTFSNLPLPTLARKAVPLVSSKTHSRLPSALLSSPRLPSPPVSNRKHSHTRLASAAVAMPIVRNRMKRSDTEPLLPVVKAEQRSLYSRPTAFKENITLSPIKPLPSMSMFGDENAHSSSRRQSTASQAQWAARSHASSDSSSQAFAMSQSEHSYSQHPALRMVKENKSSPAYRSAKDRPPTPGGLQGIGMQRWASQPVLTNTTNLARHAAPQREIKETRLMSARQAPTPPVLSPLQRTPESTVKKSRKVASPGHIRQISEQSPSKQVASSNAAPWLSATASQVRLPDIWLKFQLTYVPQIHFARPTAYWCGRLSSLVDHYRNVELAAVTELRASVSAVSQDPSATTSQTPKTHTDKLHTTEATTLRLRLAFTTLESECMMPAAKESLRQFRVRYAAAIGCPELTGPITLDPPVGVLNSSTGPDGEMIVEPGSGSGGMSEGRKVSFMDRLLGRQKRRSLVLA